MMWTLRFGTFSGTEKLASWPEKCTYVEYFSEYCAEDPCTKYRTFRVRQSPGPGESHYLFL